MSAEVEAAVREGKFPPARAVHYERLMAADPVGTRQVIAQLAPVLPMQELGGVPAPPVRAASPAVGEDAYPKEWLRGRAGAKEELGGRVIIGED